MMWTWSLLLFTVIVILVRICFKYYKMRKILDNVPGPKVYNFALGNLPIITGRIPKVGFHIAFAEATTGTSMIFREEGIFCFWLSVDPFVFLYSAETVEPVISSSTLISKAKAENLLHSWLGTGLLTSTGNKWKTRRKMITPTFHYRILDQFIPIFDKNSKLFVGNLRKYLDRDCFDILPLVSLCTLDIISESAMGVEINSQNESKSEYIQALNDFSKIFMARVTKAWLYYDFIFNLTSDGKKLKKTLLVLHDLTLKVLKQRKEELRTKDTSDKDDTNDYEYKKKEPLLDTLIKHQFQDSSFTDRDICEEVDTFMFEGHDTTAIGISWTLYHLGLYPEIQEKVYEELRSIFGDDKEKSVTTEDLREMKYLECVLKESQRISPSVPIITRKCTEDTIIKVYTIPRGCTLGIFIYALQRDPKVFPDPEKFDPDRFLPENCVGRHPFAFIPFSASSRNCIGQKYAMLEMKVIVSKVILNFQIESVEPADKISSVFTLVLRPVNGLKLKLKARK